MPTSIGRDDPDAGEPPAVTVLLCTKCYDNAAVLSRLPASATLLPIQNGFDQALEARGDFAEGIGMTSRPR